MKKTYLLKQISKTGNLDATLMSRQNKLDLLARFIEIKSVKHRIRQDQIGKEIGCSSITLHRYRQVINILSPYRIPIKSHKRKQEIPHHEQDLERPQMASKDLKRPQLTSKEVRNEIVKSTKSKSKNGVKGGSIHKNIEINSEYLCENLHNNN